MYLSFDQDWNDLEEGEGGGGGGGRHYLSWTRIQRRLAIYCTHHETIRGTPEQKYLHLTQDWNGLRRAIIQVGLK